MDNSSSIILTVIGAILFSYVLLYSFWKDDFITTIVHYFVEKTGIKDKDKATRFVKFFLFAVGVTLGLVGIGILVKSNFSGMTGSDSMIDLGFSSSRKQNEVEITPDTIVIIYSPRCGHCREAMPEFEKAVQRGNGKVVMVESDHPQGDELMNEAGSNSVPTIVKGLGTGKPIKYEGTRTADDILAFQNS